AGLLREDLYHRVAAHVVRVPSLAERRLDVPELFVHALRGFRSAHGVLAWRWERGRAYDPALPIGFVADLMRRPWSGNVRELSNLAQVTARLNLHPGAFQAPHRLSPPAAEAAGDLAAVRASCRTPRLRSRWRAPYRRVNQR